MICYYIFYYFIYGDNHAQRCQRVFAWKQYIYDAGGCEIGQNYIPIYSLRDPITRVTINTAAVTARLRGNMVRAGPR